MNVCLSNDNIKILKSILKELELKQKYLKKNRRKNRASAPSNTEQMLTMLRPFGYKFKIKKELYYDKEIMLISMKITYIHYLINPDSSAGNNGRVTHNSTLISNVDNKELRVWIRQLHKKINYV